MMARYIESDCRVFRLTCRRTKSGRWQFRVTQVSGPPLADEDWNLLLTKLVAEAVALGEKNVRWRTSL
jgi:hypothetical protein